MRELHRKLWKLGYGSISASEAEFLASCIARERPANFLEIGTATGLSTVIIATAMQQNGLGTVTTMDHSATFYGDKSKQVGFLIDEYFRGSEGCIKRMTGVTSADVAAQVELPIGMAFVDANHRHPWPAIDTLMIWPHLDRGAVLFHHDLRSREKLGDKGSGGPEYLFGCIRDLANPIVEDSDRNMFGIRNCVDGDEFARNMAECLLLPWEPMGLMGTRLARAIGSEISRHYPEVVSRAFEAGYERAKIAV